MKIRIKRRGDGVGFQIPMVVAKQTGLQPDSTVEVTVVDGRLILIPLDRGSSQLEGRLAGVSRQNIHGEVQWDPFARIWDNPEDALYDDHEGREEDAKSTKRGEIG